MRGAGADVDAGGLLLAFGLVFLSGSAFVAFAWAARDGQLEELDRGAESIFDADDPVGVRGDAFPGGDFQVGRGDREGGSAR